MVLPHNLLQGSGCPECVHRAKSHDKFIKDLQDKNKNIEVIGKYINNKTKIKCKCNICGFVWNTLPSNLLRKTRPTGCPNCWKNRNGKSHNDFVKEMSLINPNIKIIGNYINSTTKISCECKICGNIWNVVPYSLIIGKGCPICGIQKIKDIKSKTHQTFLDEIQNINPNVKILSEYKTNKEKVMCQCKIDNHIWYAKPDNLLHGYGCPKCSCSRGEYKIAEYLMSNKIYYIQQKTFDNLIGVGNGKLSYDFYLPEYNLLIEFQGKQHETSCEFFGGKEQFEIQKEHDRRKREYAKNNNIKLLEIWYFDFDNIKSILSNYLIKKIA